MSSAGAPLRSLLIGDTDGYLSPYNHGVSQGMSLLGHWHSQISIRRSIEEIAKRVADVQPHIIWTHMALWAPPGSVPREQLVPLLSDWKRRGSRVILHDGDAKLECRHPQDWSGTFSVALCNHRCDRSAWKIPVLWWPYFAWNQNKIALYVEEFKADLSFAGTVSRSSIYNERTELIERLEKTPGLHFRIIAPGYNTLFRTAEVAASAEAVLGFGRPEIPGWLDVRVFQYPGAGAVLLHDDAASVLEPYEHFIPYLKGNLDSILKAMEEVRRHGDEIRLQAFDFVQRKHSSTARCQQVLSFLGLS